MKRNAKFKVALFITLLAMVMLSLPLFAMSIFAADEVTVSFNDPEASIPSQTVTAGTSITFPDAVTEEKEGYSFVGWSTAELLEESSTKPTIYTPGASYTAKETVIFNAVYEKSEVTVTGSTTSYKLVTNVSQITVGGKVIIAAAKENYAMSTTQNTNNRASVAITKGTNTITSDPEDVSAAVFDVSAGTTSGTFAFKDAEGYYLYAASSGSNHLKRKSTLDANGSWAISVTSEGVATVKATGSYTRNWMRFNTANSPKIFACYASGQTDIALYVETKEDQTQTTYTYITFEAIECAHSETEEVTNAATCTESGSIDNVCTECGFIVSFVEIPATGHLNTTETTIKATCTAAGSITEICDDCGETVLTTTIPATGHTMFNNVCSVCGFKKVGGYILVTDASELEVGDRIIIVANDYNYALSTEQKSNNRGQTPITKNTNSITSISDSVQTITLEKGTVDGTFAFYTGSGYLYAASSSDNCLRTQNSNNNNSSWKITISDGTTSIVAQGTNTRNVMQYNQSSSLFSCYSSDSQKPISIYKESVAECPHDAIIEGAQVSLGESLAVKYHVNTCDCEGVSMRFTMNDEVVEVSESTTVNGKRVFVFGGIAPQCMGDNIKAEVIYKDDVKAALDNYSIKANLVNILDNENPSDKLEALIYDTLIYGEAARIYRNHNLDGESITAGVPGFNDYVSSAAPDVENATVKPDKSTNENVYFKGAGVRFDTANSLYVKVDIKGGVDAEKVKVTANGVDITLETYGNTYIAYTSDIMATALTTETVEFELTVDGEVVQSFEYSVTAYVAAKWGEDESLTAMQKLARALYRYGVSAAEYK